MGCIRDVSPVVGRILLALVFVLGGYNKLMGGIPGTMNNMTSHGIPMAGLLVYGVILLELVGGLMLVAGLWARWLGLIFAIYTIVLAFIFHPYWTFPAEAMGMQRVVFFNHLCLVGGMLYVFAFGAGRWSVDECRARKAQA